MKLLKLALQKQDYNLAAHILVYGLLRANQRPQDCDGEKKNDEQREKG